MYRNKHEKGIVLLEAVIAIGVLVTIFTATIALYIRSVGGVRITNDQLIATYLAQDGMEQVIAKRQYNHDTNSTWLAGMSHCVSADPCSVDYFNAALTLADPMVLCAGSCYLYRDATGKYSPDTTGTKTYFMRTVEVNQLANVFEAEVTVRVSWIDGSKTLELPVTYILYNNPN